MNRILHITPQWPTKYQTFVQDDVQISKSVFDQVLIYGFNTSESGLLRKIFWIRKFFLVISGFFRVVIFAPLISFKSMRDLRFKNSIQYLAIIGTVPNVLKSKYVIHCHFLAHTSRVASHIARLNPYLILISTAHGSEVLLSDDRQLVLLANKFNFMIFASKAILESLKQKSIKYQMPLKTRVSVRYCRTPDYQENFFDTRKFDGKLYFLSVGRMHPQKGWEKCLNMAKKMKEVGIDFRWNFIGDGPELKHLMMYTKQFCITDVVEFSGRKDRIFCIEEFKKAHFTVIPSVVTKAGCDGLPVVILEAMRASSIVISTKVGGIPEALENGRGLLFNDFEENVIQELRSLIENTEQIEMVRDAAKLWAIENTAFSNSDPLIRIYQESISGIKKAN